MRSPSCTTCILVPYTVPTYVSCGYLQLLYVDTDLDSSIAVMLLIMDKSLTRIRYSRSSQQHICHSSDRPFEVPLSNTCNIYSAQERRSRVDRLGHVSNGLADECAFPDRYRGRIIFTSSSPIVVRAERCCSSRMLGLFHPHPWRNRVPDQHRPLMPWILDPLGSVSNSPPSGRCIRLLPDPKASR